MLQLLQCELLAVFDNVERLEVVDKWRPGSGGTRVLITTRIDSEDYRWRELGIQAIPVATLPREKSLELLCRGRRDDLDDLNEQAAAEQICELLGDLPLALHLAGAYLSRYRYDVSLGEYLDDLRSQPVLDNPALVDSIRDPSPTRHLQNVAATFEMSYSKLEQDEEADALASRLFHLASHFAPAPILRELLLRALKIDEGVYGSEHPSVARDVNNLGSVLQALGDLEGAKANIERALNIFERRLGSEHPNTQIVRENLQILLGRKRP